MNIPLSEYERLEMVRCALETGQLPRYLYKYWSASSVLRFLGNHKIMFSQYTDFNDPFECASDIKTSNSAQEWTGYLLSQGVTLAETRNLVRNIVNNPTIASKTIKDAIHETIVGSGIFCMTPKPDNLLMWAHYADQHKGACIKFDLLQDVETFTFPKAVEYSNDYYSCNYLLEQDKASLAIWHKSNDWAYEDEYRIVKPAFHGLREVNPDAVVEVIFGCRCGAKDEQAITAAISALSYKNAAIRHARMSKKEYKIEII